MAMSTISEGTTWKAFMSLAENVKRLRTQKGLSQQQLAETIGVSHPRVSEIENGRSNPTLETICLLAEALETTAARLLRDSPPKKIEINP